MTIGKARRWATTRILAVVILAVQAPAFADPLAPGATLFPAPGEPDPVDGTVVAGALAVPLVAETFTGSLTTTVIAGDSSNPLGGLTFTYLLTNDTGSTNVISQLGIPHFASFLVDASYQVPTAGTPPAIIALSSTGDAVLFSFLAGIGPGSLDPGAGSALLVLQTNASNYRSTLASVIDGSIAQAASFAPAVPADFNHDGSVDDNDYAVFEGCATAPGLPYDPANLPPDCALTPDAQGRIAADFDMDGDVDQSDFGLFQRYLDGPNVTAERD